MSETSSCFKNMVFFFVVYLIRNHMRDSNLFGFVLHNNHDGISHFFKNILSLIPYDFGEICHSRPDTEILVPCCLVFDIAIRDKDGGIVIPAVSGRGSNQYPIVGFGNRYHSLRPLPMSRDFMLIKQKECTFNFTVLLNIVPRVYCFRKGTSQSRDLPFPFFGISLFGDCDNI